MQKGGLNYYKTLEDLAKSISEDKTSETVRRFFADGGSNHIIYSVPFI